VAHLGSLPIDSRSALGAELAVTGVEIECTAKRLEKGRFTWPQFGDAQGKVVLSHEELSILLGGIDLTKTKQT
jgi:transposase